MSKIEDEIHLGQLIEETAIPTLESYRQSSDKLTERIRTETDNPVLVQQLFGQILQDVISRDARCRNIYLQIKRTSYRVFRGQITKFNGLEEKRSKLAEIFSDPSLKGMTDSEIYFYSQLAREFLKKSLF
jgi:hypothetical protein